MNTKIRKEVTQNTTCSYASWIHNVLLAYAPSLSQLRQFQVTSYSLQLGAELAWYEAVFTEHGFDYVWPHGFDYVWPKNNRSR